MYLDRERLSILHRRGVEGTPTLVVEIVSPTTAATDRGAKRQLYARHAIPHFWLVEPAVPPFTELRLVPSSLWP